MGDPLGPYWWKWRRRTSGDWQYGMTDAVGFIAVYSVEWDGQQWCVYESSHRRLLLERPTLEEAKEEAEVWVLRRELAKET